MAVQCCTLGKPLQALCDGSISISVENGWSHLRLIISQWSPAGGKMYTQGKSVNTNLICMEKVTVISCDRKSLWATPKRKESLFFPQYLCQTQTLSHYGSQKSAIEKFFSLCQSKLQNGFYRVTVLMMWLRCSSFFTLIADKLILTFEIRIRKHRIYHHNIINLSQELILFLSLFLTILQQDVVRKICTTNCQI